MSHPAGVFGFPRKSNLSARNPRNGSSWPLFFTNFRKQRTDFTRVRLSCICLQNTPETFRVCQEKSRASIALGVAFSTFVFSRHLLKTQMSWAFNAHCRLIRAWLFANESSSPSPSLRLRCFHPSLPFQVSPLCEGFLLKQHHIVGCGNIRVMASGACKIL